MNSGGILTFSVFSNASLAASNPSSWGMFVYKAETSMDTKIALDGRGPSLFIFSNGAENLAYLVNNFDVDQQDVLDGVQQTMICFP